jgi:hypothetical protein
MHKAKGGTMSDEAKPWGGCPCYRDGECKIVFAGDMISSGPCKPSCPYARAYWRGVEEAKAEAWDEGYGDGVNDRRDGSQAENPHRRTQ